MGEEGQAPAVVRSASRHDARNASGGLSLLDRLTLGAVVLLVIVVSIPRLRAMAVRANENDARVTLAWLGSWLEPGAHAASGLIAALDGRPEAPRRLPDARVLSGTLSHHGYLFRIEHRGESGPVILAWPLERDRTGRACYLWDGKRLRTHGPDAEGRAHELHCHGSGVEHPPGPDSSVVDESRWPALLSTP
jgi:hypothetical protein